MVASIHDELSTKPLQVQSSCMVDVLGVLANFDYFRPRSHTGQDHDHCLLKTELGATTVSTETVLTAAIHRERD